MMLYPGLGYPGLYWPTRLTRNGELLEGEVSALSFLGMDAEVWLAVEADDARVEMASSDVEYWRLVEGDVAVDPSSLVDVHVLEIP